MKKEPSGAFLSAVFVDYDNIYLSLKRKSDEAAKRFAKDAALWLRGIETSALITPTNSPTTSGARRIVMNRCYGNPVPRRNASDNSTDMNSFPFVRHHFLRAGFEIVDCPPLTAQLKNSSDIRMVMDVRDYLTHDTYFDEFIILSGDADFTPVLHRLRAHARRTVIFANDYTAAPYTAISDGEVRESNLITLLLDGHLGDQSDLAGARIEMQDESVRHKIMAEVISAVQTSVTPVPLEVLADRAVRAIGHERTIGTGWAGAGGFRELLAQSLPEGFRLTEQAPYLVVDVKRHGAAQSSALPDLRETRAERTLGAFVPGGGFAKDALASKLSSSPLPPFAAPARTPLDQPTAATTHATSSQGGGSLSVSAGQAYTGRGGIAENQASAQLPGGEIPGSIQRTMVRIFEACQAPLLGPRDYRTLLEAMAQEITENNLNGTQTYLNIVRRGQERGLDFRRDDVRFVLDVVSEPDPWFEQGASANLFAGRFRNFVVARCRGQGLNLSADELDLIEAWFAGSTPLPAVAQQPQRVGQQSAPVPEARAIGQETYGGDRYRLFDEPRQSGGQSTLARTGYMSSAAPESAQGSGGGGQGDYGNEEFPRIVRTRLRG